MKKQHEAFPRLGRRDWLKGCAAGALCLGGRASFARHDPGVYSVVLLGDTHYDTHPATTQASGPCRKANVVDATVWPSSRPIVAFDHSW